MGRKIRRFSETGCLEFTIGVPPVTKKNHGQIVINRKSGKRMYIPSPQYREYVRNASMFIPKAEIDEPVNVQAVFYMPTKRRVDLTNLMQALHDVMVDCRCLSDDSCRIIASVDGSRVEYDKEKPRTEVRITSKEAKNK